MQRHSNTLRFALAASTALLLIASASGVAAEKVYKWTDANGVTHYGDAPPGQGEYEESRIRNGGRGGAADAAATATDAGQEGVPGAATEDPQCANVRKQLELLRGDRQLQQDDDGDGKPDRILSQSERESQAALAEAMLKANCSQAGT